MGRVVHFEIHGSNPEILAKFYSNLFGWEIKNWGGPIEYWMINTGTGEEPGIDGGIVRRQGDIPIEGEAISSFVCTINIKNLDDSLIKVNDNGGVQVVPKSPIPGIGWLAYCKDPDGNIFGMMQNDPEAK